MKRIWSGRANGFTLIELLVVVLIIGILASVALPQYQRAVKKSRATEAILMLQKIHQAQQVYEMANGKRTTDISELDIEIPEGFYRFHCHNCDGACCYAVTNDGSTPYFEGNPAGTLYCRGTEKDCKTVFNVTPAGGSLDNSYWIIKL